MCVLKIYSETKSFRGNPALDSLPVYSIYDKGDLRRKRTGELYENYRVSLDISDADWDEFPRQVEDAISFLTKHKMALSEILQSTDDADAYLDFPLWSRISEEIVNQNDHIPRELIVLAGELRIGIEMALYSRDAFESLEDGNTEKNQAEQDGTEQPATRPESKSEGSDKTQPEAEGRSR
jgi:hypothetical protein